MACAALMAALVLGVRLTARADDKPGDIPGAERLSFDPTEDSQYLGKRYQKKTEGFAVTPPAGSRIVERSGIDLVSYIVDSKQWGGSLEMVTLPKGTMSLKDFVDTTLKSLQDGQSFKGVQVMGRTPITQSGKPAERITLQMQGQLGSGLTTGMRDKLGVKNNAPDKVISLLCQEVIVAPYLDDKGNGSKFVVMTLFSPLRDQAAATHTFDAMLPNFELIDPSTLRTELVAATKTGKEWLAKRSAEEFAQKVAPDAQLFRILVNKQDLGYVEFDATTKEPGSKGSMIDAERVGRKGVLFNVLLKSFDSSGSINDVQNQAFWGFSKDVGGGEMGNFSVWDNLSKTTAKVLLAPKLIKPGGPTFEVVTPWIRESGTVTQEAPVPGRPAPPFNVTVTFDGSANQHLPNNLSTGIPVEAEVPLPSVLQYAWPRFVDVTKPSEMAFVAYNSVAHKLDLKTLVVTGKKQDVTIDGKVVSCYKCIDEVDPNSTTLWVDKNGRIQMLVTSDQTVMIPTTVDAMDAKWGARLKELASQNSNAPRLGAPTR